ncbi:iron transporter [Streptomyces aureoverticillatus]|nr:iron transporter [Streptomyces aureoverticillatus]
MLDSFLIGLRAGLAAALLVGVLVAYLARAGRRRALRAVAGGAGAAVALSLGFGCALTFGSQELTFKAREAYGGWLSLAAVVLVTWVLSGARRTARPRAAVVAAATFCVVGHGGVETSLFLWGAVRASGDGTPAPLAGVVLGLLTAAALGWLCRRGLARAGQASFPVRAGATAAVVAAGVLADGVRRLQEAEVVGGLRDKAFDVGATIPPDSWYGMVLDGAFGFRPSPTVTQTAVWALYLVAVLALCLAPSRGRLGVAGARRRAASRPR